MKILGCKIPTPKQIREATWVQVKGIWKAKRRIRKDHSFRANLDKCVTQLAGWHANANPPADPKYFFILTGLSQTGRKKLLAEHPIIWRCFEISSDKIYEQMERFVAGYRTKTKPTQIEFWQQLVYAEYIRELVIIGMLDKGYSVVDSSDNLTADDRERRGGWAERLGVAVNEIWCQGEEHLAPDFKRKKFEPPTQHRAWQYRVFTFMSDADPNTLQFGGKKGKALKSPSVLAVQL